MAEAATKKVLSISPATADVYPNAVCHFLVDPPGGDVEWDIAPRIGTIDHKTGIYTSPETIAMPQTVIVTATAKSGEAATASIDLTDAPARITWLGWYAITVGVLLAIGLLAAWNHLSRPSTRPVVVVSPSLITLDPARDESFQFSATVVGDPKGALRWSVDGGGEIDSNGVFRQKLDSAPGIDKTVRVTATSLDDTTRKNTAIVHLISGKHLEIVPPAAPVFASQQIPFRTPNAKAKWSVSRSDVAAISSDGFFTAGSPDKPMAVVQVTAWGAAPHEQAAVPVIIAVPFGRTDFGDWPLLLFVMMCGAMGSMVYFVSSFVGYVGNRTFRSSWFWFYISRPFVGGALAMIFFFMVGSGMIGGTTVSDLMKVGMISALVGLFSDKAVKKLSDVLDVLLATKDDRKDKVVEEKPKAAVPARVTGTEGPKIVSVKPPGILPNAAASVEVKGANFKDGLKVKLNGQDVTPSQQTEQSFRLEITALQALPPKVTIAVTTDHGSVSFDLPVK
jgi:hypothetical protein